MTQASRIRVLVVEDHTLFRKGIVSLLANEHDFDVVGEAANGREAIERARELRPDVIPMDISMPEMDGLEATRQIKTEIPSARIVILTISDDDRNLFEAIKSGAQGYVLKKIEPRGLFGNLRGVVRGEASISRTMATKILKEFARQTRPVAQLPSPNTSLTPREEEVLELVTLGRTNKEIAVALDIAENTAKNHLKSILEKLHLENRVQAAVYAIREGLIEEPRAPKRGASSPEDQDRTR